jgi:hypothetical protein
MAGIAVSNRVVARNHFGMFIRDCEQAAAATVSDLIDEGMDISKDLAPRGSKADHRSTPIKESFFKEMRGRTAGVWGNFSRHALHQEYGTRAHLIMGNPTMRFWWDNAGRMWIPGLYGEPDIIHHPGHSAQPFMRPAYKIVMRRAMAVARRHYPGGV